MGRCVLIGRLVAMSVFAIAAVGCHSGGTPASDVTADSTRTAPSPSGIPTYAVEVVHQYPHDAGAFTEGLEWFDGTLYESTGMVGRSGIRRVDLGGSQRAHADLAPPYFGEGITVFHDVLYELTWRQGVGFRYDARSLERRGRFTFSGEGWGLTHDAHSLIMSDGTNVLRFLDPGTLRVERTLTVTAEGMDVPRLNELERIHGEIWANVWQVPEIARIDPASGRVTSWLDIAALVPPTAPGDTIDVANGIAFDSAGDRVFVTGKLWPTLYEIKIGAKE